jgi:hypothetical protein
MPSLGLGVGSTFQAHGRVQLSSVDVEGTEGASLVILATVTHAACAGHHSRAGMGLVPGAEGRAPGQRAGEEDRMSFRRGDASWSPPEMTESQHRSDTGAKKAHRSSVTVSAEPLALYFSPGQEDEASSNLWWKGQGRSAHLFSCPTHTFPPVLTPCPAHARGPCDPRGGRGLVFVSSGLVPCSN